MSEHIQHTIDDLRAKRTAIDDLIGRLEEFQREWPITAAAVRPAIVKHVEKASRNGRTDGRTEQEPRRRAARSLPDDRGPEVIALLKRHGSLKPRELAKYLKVDAWKVARVTNPLLKAKTIAVAGKTAARTFHLPGRPPAKEAP